MPYTVKIFANIVHRTETLNAQLWEEGLVTYIDVHVYTKVNPNTPKYTPNKLK